MFKGLQCVFYKMWSCSSVAFFLHLFRGGMTNRARFLFLTCEMILCRWILWLLVAPFIKQRIFLQSYVKYIEHSRWSTFSQMGVITHLLAIAIKITLHPFSLTDSLYEHWLLQLRYHHHTVNSSLTAVLLYRSGTKLQRFSQRHWELSPQGWIIL